MKKLSALFAMEKEAAPALSDPFFGWEAAGPGLWVSHNLPLRLAVTGVGKVLSAWALALVAGQSDLVVSLGLSGALGVEEEDPESSGAVGSFFLASEFVEYDMEASALRFEAGVTPFAGMAGPVISTVGRESLALAREAALAAGLPLREARAASGDRFLSDIVKSRAIRRETGASIVDMESAAIAKLCLLRAHGADGGPLEMFAFRSVSDNADRHAGRSFASLIDAQAAYLGVFLREFAPRYCRG